MPTTGSKGKPVLAGTDAFAPATHINNAVNWAETFASVRNIADRTAMNALSGTDLWTGLTVYHTSGTFAGTFWTYNGSAWVLVAGAMPRLELTRVTTATNFFASSTSTLTTISGYTVTENRGGFTESAGTVTVPVAGRYNLLGQFAFSSGSTGYRVYNIVCGGSQTQAFRNVWGAPPSALALGTISANGVRLAAGDTVALGGIQNSGASLDLQYSSPYPIKFILEYVGP